MAIALICNLLLLFSQICSAAVTITQLEPLSDNGTTLVSKEGTFELGFFSPGSSNNRYIGIWYKNIAVRTVVWVANRDNPLTHNNINNSRTNKLVVSQEGNLVLFSQNETLVWSANATKKVPNPILQLLDSGNLVLTDANEETVFLWQSFDFPCDKLLPGMKLGWDLKSGLNRKLTAWKAWDDPSSGDFTWGVELGSNPDIVMRKGETEYFRTGPYTGNMFSGVYGPRNNPLYDYVFVNNKDQVYFRYTLKNASVISIIVMNQTLYLRHRVTWIPEAKAWTIYQSLPIDSCDVYNTCGSNGKCAIAGSPICQCLDGFVPKSSQQWNAMDWREGCVRSAEWKCGVKDRDGFRRFATMKLPNSTGSWVNGSMTLEECRNRCLANCSCTAYSNLDTRGGGSGCSIWFADLFDLRLIESGQDLYVRIATSDTDGKHGRRKKVIAVASAVASLVFLMLLTFCIYMTKRRYKGKMKTKMATVDKNEGKQEDLELPFFDLATLVKATNNFSIENKLGEGGFGPVYKGTLVDGQEIAIKRLSRSSGQGLKEFRNEVILCAKLQHRNLVKVIGYCIEQEEKMLLYEYMPNKSLDLIIFDTYQSKFLDWQMRFSILNAIARGLLYLHQDSRLRIIHRDLKLSNILLDNDMNPKISDFGLARICGSDQVEGSTSIIVGTHGYMAPEYAIDGLFSTKSDVFSFGVLLLEILSGKKNRAFTLQDNNHNLIDHAWSLWKEGTPEQLIDACLENSYDVFEVVRCIQIGLLCLQHHPNDRPNMTLVVVMLTSKNVLPEPKEPGFLIRRISKEEDSSNRQTSSSVNEASISLLNAR
ncbi:G-type lectin S-receptor-like serine/threonine-protein kinase At4g27290 isoform X1 [Vigna angularis]|uniref:G-type lectin S-receptor-like serine/threonine-protein kinase At4g27290 isoform X1 n=1 Tax=Phaseolus angularis TaxID=3914 RepID=UPI00080A5730|nr:G-type lectin S-receptor-like serine/threonine-protein kinase At4g27290 isoform X1 [Vigna angularis]